MLILCKCVHHSPPLFPSFSYLAENRNAAIGADNESYQSHQNEGSSSPDSCAAMH